MEPVNSHKLCPRARHVLPANALSSYPSKRERSVSSVSVSSVRSVSSVSNVNSVSSVSVVGSVSSERCECGGQCEQCECGGPCERGSAVSSVGSIVGSSSLHHSATLHDQSQPNLCTENAL